MLQILTTDEFAAWFAALEDGAAEDVATALETMEKLGSARAAPGSSEWLLWYEHDEGPEIAFIDDWAALSDSTKEVLGRLESPDFAAKLRALPRDEASRVMLAIEALKTGSSVRRRGLAMVAAAAAARHGRSIDPYATLREAHRAVGAALGLSIGDHPMHSSALRELTVRSLQSRFRLLYGVDPRRDVALIVLGERLDRTFYGDSVRWAERVWQQFLQNDIEARDPAPSR